MSKDITYPNEIRIELCSELADSILADRIGPSRWVTASNGDESYTEEAQDEFNILYDQFDDIVCQVLGEPSDGMPTPSLFQQPTFAQYRKASGDFLTDFLPEEWEKDWDEINRDGDPRIDEFLEEHVWEPLQYQPTKEVWEMIDTAARRMMEASNGG